MANFRSICIIFLIFSLTINFSNSLYEDQVGKFDWKKSYIGKVKYASFDTKRVIVATEENVLASLNSKTGQIVWRQIFEEPLNLQIEFLHVDNDVLTVSQTTNGWIIRTWDPHFGILQNEWTITVEKPTKGEWLVNNNELIHLVPVEGSHLEVTTYKRHSGEIKGKSKRISASWISNNCVLTQSSYVCLISNNLYYLDVLKDDVKTSSKNIQNISTMGNTNLLKLLRFDDAKPAVLVSNGVTAYLIYLNNENNPFEVMSNAVGIKNDDKTIIYELEPNLENPNKLIIVKSRTTNGFDENGIEIDYPVGLGAPQIVSGQCKATTCDLLLSSTDNAMSLVRLPEGKVLWIREEAISNIVATEFVELPVSELDASIEKEFDSTSNDIIKMFVHRLSSQFKQFYNLLFGGQLLANNQLVRDEFGLHKIIVVATKVGKLFGIDTLTGSIVWSYRLPNIRPFKTLHNYKMILYVQRTARYAPLPAQCVLFAEDTITGNGVQFEFDPITGLSNKGIERLNYRIVQSVILPHEYQDNIKPIIIYSDNNRVYVVPESAKHNIKNDIHSTYLYITDPDQSILHGYNFQMNDNEIAAIPMWKIDLSPGKLLAINTKPTNERVHSQGRVLPDRSVYYKYVNPNLIALATLNDDPVHKHVLSVYLIDGVTGLILYTNCHKRAKGPIHLVHSENWLVYSYFSERFRRTEIVATELYEGPVQSNSTVFSSHAVSLLPDVQSQSYILPVNPLAMAVTLTERGITSKFLLVGLSNGGVTEIPWMILQPRFANIPCTLEESCIPYMPEIQQPSESMINYNQTVGRISNIEVAPARLESTCHVLVHGLDLFYTRVAPSKGFDVLKEDFDYNLILFVLTGLIIASYITKRLASQKALKQVWK